VLIDTKRGAEVFEHLAADGAGLFARMSERDALPNLAIFVYSPCKTFHTAAM
jgi:hypothetical protein